MRRLDRFSPVIRIAALVLLVWTGVDLAAPGMCMLDQERDTPLSSHALQQVEKSGDDATSAPAHVDDCFCCSRCVTPTVAAVVSQLELSSRTESVLPDGLPIVRSSALDHPPQ